MVQRIQLSNSFDMQLTLTQSYLNGKKLIWKSKKLLDMESEMPYVKTEHGFSKLLQFLAFIYFTLTVSYKVMACKCTELAMQASPKAQISFIITCTCIPKTKLYMAIQYFEMKRL